MCVSYDGLTTYAGCIPCFHPLCIRPRHHHWVTVAVGYKEDKIQLFRSVRDSNRKPSCCETTGLIIKSLCNLIYIITDYTTQPNKTRTHTVTHSFTHTRSI